MSVRTPPVRSVYPSDLSPSDPYARSIWDDLAAGEAVLSLAEARGLPALRRGTERVNLASIYRWTDGGSRPVGGGDRVKLETVQQAGRRATTASAVLRFLRALSGDATPRPRVTNIIDADRAADRRMAAAGL